MLLERIRLQGFLSHYGTVDDEGALGPTELDFTDADLWLVHGPNGAGKSAAVFDAIGFALYKQHRGGVQGAGDLVHQDAQEATVSVDVDLGGQRYRIGRHIKKKTGRVTPSLFEADGEGWRPLDLDGKLEDWVEHQLGMPFETFQACILLRQGEADSFLKAKPQARRKALFDLVRLRDYERLETLAKRQTRTAADEQKRLAGELEKLGDATPEARGALVATRAEAAGAKEEAGRRAAAAAEAKTLADTAVQLRTSIRQQQAVLAKHRDLLDRAEVISRGAERRRDLDAALPALRALHRARTRATTAEGALATLEEEHQALLDTTPVLTTTVETADRTYTDAEAVASSAATIVAERQTALADAKGLAKATRAQIANHSKVGAAEACPVCAAALDSDEAKARVDQHYQVLEAKLASLDETVLSLTRLAEDADAHRDTADHARERARTARDTAASELKTHLDTLAQVPGRLSVAQAALDAAHAEVETCLADMPSAWMVHPAVKDDTVVDGLSKERDGLEGALDEMAALNTARLETDPAQAKVHSLTDQLAAIPETHRRADPDALDVEHRDALRQVTAAEDALAEADKAIGALEAAIARRSTLAAEHDVAERTAGRYKRLAEAFGPKHLQARVLRDAQIRVMQNANQTLRALTNGGWSISLVEDGDDLEVLALDPLGTERAFAFLSGGERFRVAVALAVGVGQTVSGGRSVRSLLVDEGFGALDDSGRSLMVEELHRLRAAALDGGRVVVVAHQDDVKDQFDHRFEITKPTVGASAGRAVVTRSASSDDG